MYNIRAKQKEKLNVDYLAKPQIVFSTDTSFNQKQLKQICIQGQVLFEFFARKHEKTVTLWYGSGVIYMTESLVGYVDKALHLKKSRNQVLNISLHGESLYLLEQNTVCKFLNEKLTKKIEGTFKFPTKKVVEVENLYKVYSEKDLRACFSFAETSENSFLVSNQKLSVIKHKEIIQTISVEERIKGFLPKHPLTIEGTLFDFCVEKNLPPNSPELGQSPEFKPDMKTLHAIENSDFVSTAIDLHWKNHFSQDLEEYLNTQWSLEPLDRSYLSSHEFYEKLYDYLENFLPLTVQGFFMTNPQNLIVLQEALREQESKLYADGHLHPKKSITSLISESIPPVSPFDTQQQKRIRAHFSSHSSS